MAYMFRIIRMNIDASYVVFMKHFILFCLVVMLLILIKLAVYTSLIVFFIITNLICEWYSDFSNINISYFLVMFA